MSGREPTDVAASGAQVAVLGGGPAGLMAAEAAVATGATVQLYDAMASCGRKFLIAGKGGLNLTHRDHGAALLERYGERAAELEAALGAFDAEDIRRWAASLGVATFVGSSGRVFPDDMKSAPLLRRWLKRLRSDGVRFHPRHRWLGWNSAGELRFEVPQGSVTGTAGATVLALGGASWPRLGSSGAWVEILAARGIEISPLRASNCGFECEFSPFLRAHYAGHPVKSVALSVTTTGQRVIRRVGEFILTDYGVEGSLIYALSAQLRGVLERDGTAIASVDLAPDRSAGALAAALAQPRGSRTVASHLKRRAGISGVKAALLREFLPRDAFSDPHRLAAGIKSLPLRLERTRPIAEAISSAGGVRFDGVDEKLMLRGSPGLFVAGEMLDWNAPTGGYLLTACLATGRLAGHAAGVWAATRHGTTQAPDHCQ